MKFVKKDFDQVSRFKQAEFDSDFEKGKQATKGKKKSFDLGFERSNKDSLLLEGGVESSIDKTNSSNRVIKIDQRDART